MLNKIKDFFFGNKPVEQPVEAPVVQKSEPVVPTPEPVVAEPQVLPKPVIVKAEEPKPVPVITAPTKTAPNKRAKKKPAK